MDLSSCDHMKEGARGAQLSSWHLLVAQGTAAVHTGTLGCDGPENSSTIYVLAGIF